MFFRLLCETPLGGYSNWWRRSADAAGCVAHEYPGAFPYMKGGAKGLLRVPNHNMIVYDSDFRQSNLNFGYVFPLMMDTQQKKHRKHLWDPMFTWRHDEASASHPKFIIEPIDSRGLMRFGDISQILGCSSSSIIWWKFNASYPQLQRM